MKESRHFKKRWVLLNPGPVNVTERVRRALLRPDICHREEEFSKLLRGVRQKLLSIFKIEKTHAALLLTGSGTLAVEAMLSAYGAFSKKILVVSNGVYGERMAAVLKSHGLTHRVISSELGHFPGIRSIENILKSDKKIEALALVHHETSTGMLNPLSDVQKIARRYGKTLLVDAVSSLGAEKIDLKAVDFSAGSSGKCLHGFPGISFVLVSKKFVSRLQRASFDSAYLNLAYYLNAAEQGQTPFTPAVQLLYAFEEALKELKEETLPRRIESYRQKSKLLQDGLEHLGIDCLVEKKYRSHVLTAFRFPKGLSYRTLHDGLKKQGFVIYEGQSALKGKIFRIAHLGNITQNDLRRFLKRLGTLLKRHGK